MGSKHGLGIMLYDLVDRAHHCFRCKDHCRMKSQNLMGAAKADRSRCRTSEGDLMGRLHRYTENSYMEQRLEVEHKVFKRFLTQTFYLIIYTFICCKRKKISKRRHLFQQMNNNPMKHCKSKNFTLYYIIINNF